MGSDESAGRDVSVIFTLAGEADCFGRGQMALPGRCTGRHPPCSYIDIYIKSISSDLPRLQPRIPVPALYASPMNSGNPFP